MINVNENFKAIVLKTDETKFLSISVLGENKSSFIVQYKDYNHEEVIKLDANETLSSLHFKFTTNENSDYLSTLLKSGRIADISIKHEITVKDEIEFADIKLSLHNSDLRMYHVSNELFTKAEYNVIASKNILQNTHYFNDGALGFHCTNKPFEEIGLQSKYKNMSKIFIYAVHIKDDANIKFVNEEYYNNLIGDGDYQKIQELRLKLLQNDCDVLMTYKPNGSMIEVTNCIVIDLESIEITTAINPKNTNLSQSIFYCEEDDDDNQYTGSSSNRFMG